MIALSCRAVQQHTRVPHCRDPSRPRKCLTCMLTRSRQLDRSAFPVPPSAILHLRTQGEHEKAQCNGLFAQVRYLKLFV